VSTDAHSIAACSSEGGLFEYGDDEAVTANLAALREILPADACAIDNWMTYDARLRKAPVLRRGQSDPGSEHSYFAASVGIFPCDSTTRLAIRFSITTPLRRVLM
jgi:hypothetical protein